MGKSQLESKDSDSITHEIMESQLETMDSDSITHEIMESHLGTKDSVSITHEITKSQLETKETKSNSEIKELAVALQTESVTRDLISEINVRETSPERTSNKSKIPKIKTNIELENRVKKITATCDLVLDERKSKSSLLIEKSTNKEDKMNMKLANESSKEDCLNTSITIVVESEENKDVIKTVEDH